MRNNKTAELVLTALFAAIIIIMAFTPLGYIPLVVINATIIHIPVILGALFCGPKKGGFLGFIFGLTSFIKNTVMPTSLSAFVFSPVLAASMVGTSGIVKSAFICFVPRILVGILPYFVYIGVKKALSSRHKILWASVFNILIGVFLFLGARAFLLHVFDKKPLSDIALYAVSALVGWFVFMALEGVYGTEIRRSLCICLCGCNRRNGQYDTGYGRNFCVIQRCICKSPECRCRSRAWNHRWCHQL